MGKKLNVDEISSSLQSHPLFKKKEIEQKEDVNNNLLVKKQTTKQDSLTTSKEVSKLNSMQVNNPTSKEEKNTTTKPVKNNVSDHGEKFASYLPRKLHTEFKINAIRQGKKLAEVLQEAVEEYLNTRK